MKKLLLSILGCAIGIIVIMASVGIVKFNFINDDVYVKENGQWVREKNVSKNSNLLVGIDAKNSTYLFEEGPVTLVNGRKEKEFEPGAASKQITQYFGNELKTDVNDDGKEDVVFFLTQNSGGSGTFFYIAGALALKDGYRGTNVIFLGDRIIPQAITYENEEICVNYKDRKPDEPMVTKPSVKILNHFKIADGKLIKITGQL